jgi:branched-chain amino acid transport system substrate-binding protein
MAEYLQQSGRAKRLVVLHANDAYANALVDAFVTRFTQVGGEIVANESYPTTTTAFEPILRRLPMRGHDGYYIVGFPPDLAALYNVIRRVPETASMPIYSAVGIESGDFRRLARAELDNLFFTAPSVDESSPQYFEFREAYRTQFGGEAPDIVAAITYDALRIAVGAIRATSCDSTSVRNYLYSMGAFPGVTGPTAFDDYGDVVTKPVAIKYFEKGQLRLALESSEKR